MGGHEASSQDQCRCGGFGEVCGQASPGREAPAREARLIDQEPAPEGSLRGPGSPADARDAEVAACRATTIATSAAPCCTRGAVACLRRAQERGRRLPWR